MSIYTYTPVLVYSIVLAICIGAATGSFLNCAAWRIVHGESFLKGRSHCPNCNHALGVSELIPIISWLIQKGRCKHCGAKISIRYPLTELAFALITVLCLLRFELTFLALRNFLFLAVLFLLSLTDLEDMIIPDGCHIAAIIIWVAGLPFNFDGWKSVGFSVLALAVFGGGLLLISLLMDKILGRESLGGGDIKLVGVTALYLGFVGNLLMIIIACIAGLVFNSIAKRAGDKQFPFGPWIALAAGLVLLYGEPVIDWYMNLLGIS